MYCCKYFKRTFMLRAFFLFLATLLLGLFANSQKSLAPDSFVLRGRATGMDGQYVYLGYLNSKGIVVRDSALVQGNGFFFSGCVAVPTKSALSRKTSGASRSAATTVFIYLEPANLEISIPDGKFNELQLKGSRTQAEADELGRMRRGITTSIAPLMKSHDSLNNIYSAQKKRGASEDSLELISKQMSALRKQMTPFFEQGAAIDKQFYQKYPCSFVTVYGLRSSVPDFSYSELMDYYGQMSDEVKNSPIGKEFKEAIDKRVIAVEGKTAPGFTALEFRGDSVRLSDYKGKYVLLDFWASWCVPCRKGNPQLIGLYNKYKDKGIEFIGIASDDGNEAAWKKAIERDKIGIWKHVLSGRVSEKVRGVGEVYTVYTLPTKVLIDPTGHIIGRYEGEKEDEERMVKQLENLFDKN